METLVMKKDYKGLKKGNTYSVVRNIMGECVVIVEDEKTPNVILSEKQAKRIGVLSGRAYIHDVGYADEVQL